MIASARSSNGTAAGLGRRSRQRVPVARTPGFDHAYETNRTAADQLLPPPAQNPGAGAAKTRSRLMRELGHQSVGVDASPAWSDSRSLIRSGSRRGPVAPRCCSATRPSTWSSPTYRCRTSTTCRKPCRGCGVLVASGRLYRRSPPASTGRLISGSQPDAPSGSAAVPGTRAAACPTRPSDFKLTFHSEHRPLETYADGFEAGGLLIEKLPGSAYAARWNVAPAAAAAAGPDVPPHPRPQAALGEGKCNAGPALLPE